MREAGPRPSRLRSWALFLLRRLGLLVIVLFSVCVLTFAVTRSTGTPLYAALGMQVTEEMIEARAEMMGLNDPIHVQFTTYMVNLLKGDLGTSRRTFTPVAGEIRYRLPATAELVFYTLVVSAIWAVPLGVRAAVRPNGPLARIGEGLAQFGVSVPAFWLGLLLIFLLYFLLPVFPAPLGRLSGADPPPFITGFYTLDALADWNPRLAWEAFRHLVFPAVPLAVFYMLDALADWNSRLAWEALRHLVLPAVTLSVTSGPPLFRVTRSAVGEALSSPFVEAAHSYGLSRRKVMIRDVFRNASPPVLNLAAMTFGYLIGGAVLVEVVFSWPGIGSYAVWGMGFSDYDVVLGVVIVSAAIYVVLYFIVDLVQYAMDPRLRD